MVGGHVRGAVLRRCSGAAVVLGLVIDQKGVRRAASVFYYLQTLLE
jgi:hypothetical protein